MGFITRSPTGSSSWTRAWKGRRTIFGGARETRTRSFIEKVLTHI
jgi:hypothetical protein